MTYVSINGYCYNSYDQIWHWLDLMPLLDLSYQLDSSVFLLQIIKMLSQLVRTGSMWIIWRIFFFKIQVQLIYDVLLFGLQQSDSHIYTHVHTHIYFFIFFFIVVYYKILNMVTSAIQQILVVYLLYIQQFVSANPKLLIYPSSPAFPFSNHKFFSCVFCFVNKFFCIIIQISYISGIMYLSFSDLFHLV